MSRGNGSSSSRRPSPRHLPHGHTPSRLRRPHLSRRRRRRRMHLARTFTYSVVTAQAPPKEVSATIFGAWTWRPCIGQTPSSLAMFPRRGGTPPWLSRLCRGLAPVARLSTEVAPRTESHSRTRTALTSRRTSGLASRLMRWTSTSSTGRSLEATTRRRLPRLASPRRLPI